MTKKGRQTMWGKLIHLARFSAAATFAATLLAAGPALAALQDRDLDKNGQVDAFYDTDLDITWLRDANALGRQTDWYTAVAWAANFSIGGYGGWRLPTSVTCTGYDCTGSEMGHLWYLELGNSSPGPMTNTGSFQNMQAYSYYWSGTDYALDANRAYRLQFSTGEQGASVKSIPGLNAMAVHNGDVGAVPEPQTAGMLLAGLTALALASRRRRR
jgi:hypothetical protein